MGTKKWYVDEKLDCIFGYEPYFGKFRLVGVIDHTNKEIRPTHGYFYPHPYGKLSKKYAEEIGYEFNNS